MEPGQAETKLEARFPPTARQSHSRRGMVIVSVGGKLSTPHPQPRSPIDGSADDRSMGRRFAYAILQ